MGTRVIRKLPELTIDGDVMQSGDSWKITGIQTKPNGSNSNYISVGKREYQTDDVGDIALYWTHYGYPWDFKDLIKFRREEYGRGNQTNFSWTFLISNVFLEKDFALAIVGTGKGGRGYQDNRLRVFFSNERIRGGENVIFS
jgi:hypothetical protein